MGSLLEEELDRARLGQNWTDVDRIAKTITEAQDAPSSQLALAYAAQAQALYWQEAAQAKKAISPPDRVTELLETSLKYESSLLDSNAMLGFLSMVQGLPNWIFSYITDSRRPSVPSNFSDEKTYELSDVIHSLSDFAARPFAGQELNLNSINLSDSDIKHVLKALEHFEAIADVSFYFEPKFAEKFLYRFYLALVSRAWYSFCFILNGQYSRAIKTLVEARDAVIANSKIVFVPELNDIGHTKTSSVLLRGIADNYNLISTAIGGFSVVHGLASSQRTSEDKPKSLALTSDLCFAIGDLLVSVIATSASLAFIKSNISSVFEIYRGVLAFNQPSSVSIDQYRETSSCIAAAYKFGNPIAVSVHSNLMSKYGIFLMTGVSDSLYLRVNECDDFRSRDSESLLISMLAQMNSSSLYVQKSPVCLSFIRRLTFSLCLSSKFSAASEILRHATCNDMDNFQLWYKLALALCCSEEYEEAYRAIRTCIHINSGNVNALILGAKICLNHLNRTEEALSFAKDALNLISSASEENQRELLCSCQSIYAICCSKYAYEVSNFAKRKSFQEDAIKHLEKVNETTPDNVNVIFQLALVKADIRDIASAVYYAKLALALNPGSEVVWRLLALLSSTSKSYQKALVTCEKGTQECGKSDMYVNLLLFVLIG
jgi:tetratricopeptide (TPR) repeat protein